jgi:hypothetical protein
MVVALTAGANAASQMRRMAQDGYGSFSMVSAEIVGWLMSAFTP